MSFEFCLRGKDPGMAGPKKKKKNPLRHSEWLFVLPAFFWSSKKSDDCMRKRKIVAFASFVELFWVFFHARAVALSIFARKSFPFYFFEFWSLEIV